MRNVLTVAARFVLLMSLVVGFAILASGQVKSQQVPKEVQAIVGTYTGSWTSYGLNEQGQVVRQAAWTDSIKAENPTVAADRAYVTTTDELVFEGGRIPPTRVPGTEGYLLNRDGSLGDYFLEVFGQTYRMQKLGKDTWAYVTEGHPREFAQLGAERVLSAQHVLIKVVTFEQGVETHNVSRMTTVKWKDAGGKERTTQFVSLQGQHKRRPV